MFLITLLLGKLKYMTYNRIQLQFGPSTMMKMAAFVLQSSNLHKDENYYMKKSLP